MKDALSIQDAVILTAQRTILRKLVKLADSWNGAPFIGFRARTRAQSKTVLVLESVFRARVRVPFY